MWPFNYPYTNFHEINLDWILETVKSNTDRITENEIKIKLIGGDDPLNTFHPVGSIFISTENTSPASMFGGEWEQIKGRFLLGADSTRAAGSTGGEANVTLSKSQVPYEAELYYYYDGNGSDIPQDYCYFKNDVWAYSTGTTKGYINKFGPTRDATAHNNMPPYLAVYLWKRVS